MHTNEDGNVLIPPSQFKSCLAAAAKYNSRKIPGERNGTYTKNFKSGIQVIKPLVLPDKVEKVPFEDVLCSSNGVPGGGSKVIKRFGLVQSWKGTVEFLIADEKITSDIFSQYLREAGQFIGIGRYRPQNGGFLGTFILKELDWADYVI